MAWRADYPNIFRNILATLSANLNNVVRMKGFTVTKSFFVALTHLAIIYSKAFRRVPVWWPFPFVLGVWLIPFVLATGTTVFCIVSVLFWQHFYLYVAAAPSALFEFFFHHIAKKKRQAN